MSTNILIEIVFAGNNRLGAVIDEGAFDTSQAGTNEKELI